MAKNSKNKLLKQLSTEAGSATFVLRMRMKSYTGNEFHGFPVFSTQNRHPVFFRVRDRGQFERNCLFVCLFVCLGLTSLSTLSVISRRCLVVTGSSMLTFIVLPHCGIRSQTLLPDTTSSHIILTPKRPVLALPRKSECQAGSN